MSNSSFDKLSIFAYFNLCFNLRSTYFHFIAYILVNVPFVLPLCLYILRLGAQQWRRRVKISHSDFFTYNMVVVHLLCITGSFVLTVNLALLSQVVTTIGIYTLLITYSAIVVFQVLTCIEHYMAVVHPVTYLRLKSQTKTRNISCGFAWLQCVIQSIYFSQMQDFDLYFALCLLGYSLSLLAVLFCNICVLCVLMRPRPGDATKGNKSKQKAFYTITAITATLLVKFGGDMFSTLSFVFLAKTSITEDGYAESCRFYFSLIWFTLPSSLVLPLLFLHRNEKLMCCKTNK